MGGFEQLEIAGGKYGIPKIWGCDMGMVITARIKL